ncbi:hypothetical protein MY3296_008035 [Beauveria thailandica]
MRNCDYLRSEELKGQRSALFRLSNTPVRARQAQFRTSAKPIVFGGLQSTFKSFN